MVRAMARSASANKQKSDTFAQQKKGTDALQITKHTASKGTLVTDSGC